MPEKEIEGFWDKGPKEGGLWTTRSHPDTLRVRGESCWEGVRWESFLCYPWTSPEIFLPVIPLNYFLRRGFLSPSFSFPLPLASFLQTSLPQVTSLISAPERKPALTPCPPSRCTEP